MRHEKGLANAERNLDKHERKVAESKSRAKRVDERRAAWEELNAKATAAEDDEAKKPSAKEGAKKVKKDTGKAQPMDGVDLMAPMEEILVAEQPAEAGTGVVEKEIDDII